VSLGLHTTTSRLSANPTVGVRVRRVNGIVANEFGPPHPS